MHKVAILIDGGFFLKRLKKIAKNNIIQTANNSFNISDTTDILKLMHSLKDGHLTLIHKYLGEAHPSPILYRTFFYDALPLQKRVHYPISKQTIDFSKTPEALFRLELFEKLKFAPNLALRLGEVREGKGWVLNQEKQKFILDQLKKGNTLSIDVLKDDDFRFDMRQKAVDMRIGVDITSLSLKKQVDTIVLISGDGDFMPAAKLARVEGIKVAIDMMGQELNSKLLEHVDLYFSSLMIPKDNDYMQWDIFT